MFSFKRLKRPIPDYQIYADQMYPPGFGIPLWYGNHTSTDTVIHDIVRQPAPLHCYDQVNIGDVGYIRGRQFHRLFSAGCALGDRVLGRDVPEDFRPLDPLPIVIGRSEPRKPGPLATASVKVSGGEAGVSLNIHVDTMLSAERLSYFHDYIIANFRSWEAFARSRGHDVTVEDIVLVSGCGMTADFTMLAFSQTGNDLAISFDAGASVAIRRIKLLPKVIKAGAGPHGLGPGEKDVMSMDLSFEDIADDDPLSLETGSAVAGSTDEDTPNEEIQTTSMSLTEDPLLTIAQYIFEVLKLIT
ncbi:hypothetical protein EUX98_g3303 [Antrodiella citrinella]|uniref:Uncharacterized protein n=1 Tax=Antrodiella citrinella TaxID=2447956 RepID=A0A4S4MWY5_9APHY|nr:hypothetical protein EUX98_g3303 [Antrodiella citrinella]